MPARDTASPPLERSDEVIEIDPARRLARLGGRRLALGGRAFDLLAALAARPGEFLDAGALIGAVWPGRVVEANNLRMQVTELRRQLGAGAVANVPGRGYRLELAVRRAAAAQALRLIGRDDELRELQALAAEHRLLTVAGAGGIGKTSLVRAWFDRQQTGLAQAQAWVDLAGAGEGQLPARLAAAAGLRPGGPDAPLAATAAALQARDWLLVLDNAEHLAAALRPLVEGLLGAAPRLRLVLTSQIPLRLPPEHVFRLGPLELPEHGSTPAQALRRAALALFVARVQALDRDFTLGEAQLPAAIELCRSLDGLPLAIELAAARVPALGVQALARSLDERLQVLHSPAHSRPQRQQTLRAALEWTHGLLAAPAQAVFARLGVFSGRFTLAAAQAVATDAPGEGPIDRLALLDAIEALVDASMVALDDAAGDEPRYRLLETPRLFAVQRLHEAGLHDTFRRRHLAWCLAEVGRADAGQLAADAAQLQAALDWALSGGDPAGGAALAQRLVGHPGLAALPPAPAAPGPADDTLPRLLARLQSAGVLRHAERAGLGSDTLQSLARRLRPAEARDLPGAVRELNAAVDLARAALAAPAPDEEPLDRFVGDVLADVAEHTRRGLFDEGSDRIDEALAELARREARRREAHRASLRRLLEGGVQQDLLRRDAFAVARRTAELLALDEPAPATQGRAWRQREDEALARGQASAGSLWLEVAVEMARRRLAEARDAAGRTAARCTLAQALNALGERESGNARLLEAAQTCGEGLAEVAGPAAGGHAGGNAGAGANTATITSAADGERAAWGALHHERAVALGLLGQRSGDAARLEEAVRCSEAALRVRTRAAAPLAWAATQHTRGNALRVLGMLGTGTLRLEEAAQVLREALQERTPGRAPIERARTLNALGITLSVWASREEGLQRHREALAAQQAALALLSPEATPALWATVCNNIGIEYNFLGSDGGETEENCRAAVAAFERALTVQTREATPGPWARTQHNLGAALAYLGEHLADPALLGRAAEAFRQSLLENTRERQPLAWSASQNDLGTTLGRRARLTPGDDGTALFAQALQHLGEALTVRTREAMPNEWLRTEGDVAFACFHLAQHTGEPAGARQAQASAQALVAAPEAARMPVERSRLLQLLADIEAWLAGRG